MGSGVTWWHRGGTWCWHPFGDTRMAFSTWGHDVELGICISLVAQGWLCPGAPSSTLQQGWHLWRWKRAAGGCVTTCPVCLLSFLSSIPRCSITCWQNQTWGGRLCTPWDTGDAALCLQEGAAQGCASRERANPCVGRWGQRWQGFFLLVWVWS